MSSNPLVWTLTLTKPQENENNEVLKTASIYNLTVSWLRETVDENSLETWATGKILDMKKEGRNLMKTDYMTRKPFWEL